MSTDISDITKLSAVKTGCLGCCSVNLRTPWTTGSFDEAGKDNGVFVEIRSKNYENDNLSKAGY